MLLKIEIAFVSGVVIMKIAVKVDCMLFRITSCLEKCRVKRLSEYWDFLNEVCSVPDQRGQVFNCADGSKTW